MGPGEKDGQYVQKMYKLWEQTEIKNGNKAKWNDHLLMLLTVYDIILAPRDPFMPESWHWFPSSLGGFCIDFFLTRREFSERKWNSQQY